MLVRTKYAPNKMWVCALFAVIGGLCLTLPCEARDPEAPPSCIAEAKNEKLKMQCLNATMKEFMSALRKTGQADFICPSELLDSRVSVVGNELELQDVLRFALSAFNYAVTESLSEAERKVVGGSTINLVTIIGVRGGSDAISISKNVVSEQQAPSWLNNKRDSSTSFAPSANAGPVSNPDNLMQRGPSVIKPSQTASHSGRVGFSPAPFPVANQGQAMLPTPAYQPF